MTRARRALLTAIVVAASSVLSGCAATMTLDATIDRSGRSNLAVELRLDAEAQAYLQRPGISLTGTDVPNGDDVAAALFPWANAANGWRAPDNAQAGAAAVAAARAPNGDLILRTTHPDNRSPRALQDVLGTAQATDLLVKPGDTVTSLPGRVALLNNVNFTLDLSGSRPDFSFFGRGGVGTIGAATCAGNALVSGTAADQALRGGLSFVYRISFPGRPARTTATKVLGNDADWRFRYGDCPRLSAASNLGSSSAFLNGVILAGATFLLLVVLGLRALRPGRGR